MSKHMAQYVSLGELAKYISDEVNNEEWFRVMGLEIEGYDEASALIGDDDPRVSNSAIDKIEELKKNYIQTHRDEIYKVSWPDHVSCPRFDSDASYQYLGTVSSESYTITDGECRNTGELRHYIFDERGILVPALTVEADMENDADKFWTNFRELMPIWAKVFSEIDQVRLPVSVWEEIKKIKGFSEGPEFAKNALIVVEASE